MTKERRPDNWYWPPERDEAVAKARAESQAKIVARQAEEAEMIAMAKRTGISTSYIASDGCEVTITPSGHVFYNVGDWY